MANPAFRVRCALVHNEIRSVFFSTPVTHQYQVSRLLPPIFKDENSSRQHYIVILKLHWPNVYWTQGNINDICMIIHSLNDPAWWNRGIPSNIQQISINERCHYRKLNTLRSDLDSLLIEIHLWETHGQPAQRAMKGFRSRRLGSMLSSIQQRLLLQW